MTIKRNAIVDFLYKIVTDNFDKRIVIFGSDQHAEKVANYLKAIKYDFLIDFFVDINVEGSEEYILNHPIKNAYDLLYNMHNVIVIVANDNIQASIEFLESLGTFKYYVWEFDFAKKCDIVDSLLGYSRYDDIEGYFIYETSTKAEPKLKILALGGSTTDGAFTNEKSWPKYFADQLQLLGIEVTVYNGGLIGYNSSQELLKLTRDITTINPDIVISYSGINDFYKGTNNFETPYTSPYATNCIFSFISEYLPSVNQKETKTSMGNVKRVGHGIESKLEGYEIWINNLHKMNALCSVFGIAFYGFLQATAFSSGYKRSEIEERYFKIRYSERALKEIKKNVENAEKAITALNRPNMLSLESLFENKGGVFYDHCHCMSESNEIISQYILSVIKHENEYFRNLSPIS